jgi:hypothetical protein
MNVMFKIQNGLIPPYLKNICPPLTRNRTEYNLRTGMNITVPFQRTTTYQKSYFPQTIKDWNNLDINFRQSPSIENFKDKIKATSNQKPNPLYHHNNSKAAINQTRMRLGLSALSSQRFNYKHIDDPKCNYCNARVEDPCHFFMTCPNFALHRPELMINACGILFKYDIQVDFRKQRFRNFFIETILGGSTVLTPADNKALMNLCQNYIRESQRFP